MSRLLVSLPSPGADASHDSKARGELELKADESSTKKRLRIRLPVTPRRLSNTQESRLSSRTPSQTGLNQRASPFSASLSARRAEDVDANFVTLKARVVCKDFRRVSSEALQRRRSSLFQRISSDVTNNRFAVNDEDSLLPTCTSVLKSRPQSVGSRTTYARNQTAFSITTATPRIFK